MKKHLNIRITGKVQGVFFRQTTQEKAEELGIAGLVRNQDDGSVYIEAEGEPAQLDKLVAWCHRGPKSAVVEKVVPEEGELKGYTGFIQDR